MATGEIAPPQALDRTPGGRAAFLDQACADDPALREEVESLLAAHGRADSFLETPAVASLVEQPDGSSETLSAGFRLGPYEIVAPIGAGGMGEVYKARDLRLNRTVAIKVLPRALALDPALRSRLEREARALAALSHPQVCAIFDVGRDGETDFVVMELLDGESLAERLQRGPLPPADLLRYGIQIASALEGAHREGVIHRDLKPRNIVLTKSGAKLIDFGLAKRGQVRLIGVDAAAPTDDVSVAGMLLGTVHYMAPEQLRGAEADVRSDIFALGAVISEMATGTPAFAGSDQASVIAAILTQEPPRLDPSLGRLAAPLDRVVRTCLAKDPDERWQSAGDVRRLLEWLASEDSAPRPAELAPRSRKWLAAAVGFAALVGLVGIASGIVAWNAASTLRTAAVFSVIPPGRYVSYGPMGMPQFAVAPDGDRLVFVAQSAEGQPRLWVRALEALEPEALAGTDGAVLPFWSPDGQSLGFFTRGNVTVSPEMKIIDLVTRTVRTLCKVRDPRGATWNRDGVILFADRDLFRIPAVGGRVTTVASVDLARNELTYRWPSFLPDGRRFVVTKTSADRPVAEVVLAALDDAAQTRLFDANSNVVPLAGQRVVLFVEDGKLMAWPFEPDRGRVIGDPFALGPLTAHNPQFSVAAFSSNDSDLLVYGRSINLVHELAWFDRSGRRLQAVGPAGTYGGFRVSPDGRRVLAARMEPTIMRMGLRLFDTERGVASRVRSDPLHYNFPIWSPDSTYLAYSAAASHDLSIYRAAVDGGGEERLVHSPRPEFPRSWSPDGRVLLYEVGNTEATRRDLWVLRPNAQPEAFLASAYDERFGQFSPDGNWVAYESDETGTREIYLCAFPSASRRMRVSVNGGSEPRWSRDMKELFYLTTAGEVMSSPIRLHGSPEVGRPRVLFRAPIRVTGEPDNFDVSPDGQRFLLRTVLKEPGEQAAVTVMINGISRLLLQARGR